MLPVLLRRFTHATCFLFRPGACWRRPMPAAFTARSPHHLSGGPTRTAPMQTLPLTPCRSTREGVRSAPWFKTAPPRRTREGA